MMKRILLIALFAGLTYIVNAQMPIDGLLQSIEQNNTQLKALREMLAAEKLDNKTTNNLSNPELEVTHMPRQSGSLATTGIEATQAFDFPTAYKHRGDVIAIENERVDLAYEVQKREVLSEARKLIVEYVYLQKQQKYMVERMIYARDLYKAYENLFSTGNVSILERNKTKLYLLEAEKDVQVALVDLDATEAELKRMNGDQGIGKLEAYSNYQLPLDFKEWFANVKHNNPALQMAEKSVEAGRKQVQLARSLNLPKLRAGYVGDLVKNESRHGFLVSVSVPLWEGRNTVKSKQTQTLALQYEKEDIEYRYESELKKNFDKAQRLSAALKEYSEVIDNSNNFDLLRKAFDMGQIGLIEYLQELMIYNDAVNSYHVAERDFHIVLNELEQWER